MFAIIISGQSAPRRTCEKDRKGLVSAIMFTFLKMTSLRISENRMAICPQVSFKSIYIRFQNASKHSRVNIMFIEKDIEEISDSCMCTEEHPYVMRLFYALVQAFYQPEAPGGLLHPLEI